MNVKRKIIVTIAPTGGVVKKSKNPHLPTQPSEIAEDVYRCYDAGASIVALHARRQDDGATCSSEIYQDINSRIRTKCCIVINNSTGGGIDGDMVRSIGPGLDEVIFEQRLQGFEAGADMATFGAHTVLASFGGREIFVNTSPTRCDIMAKRFQKTGIKPEWECFSLSHLLQDPIRLINKGFDKPPYWINFVLGADRGIQGDYRTLRRFSICSSGIFQKERCFALAGSVELSCPPQLMRCSPAATFASDSKTICISNRVYLPLTCGSSRER